MADPRARARAIIRAIGPIPGAVMTADRQGRAHAKVAAHFLKSQHAAGAKGGYNVNYVLLKV